MRESVTEYTKLLSSAVELVNLIKSAPFPLNKNPVPSYSIVYVFSFFSRISFGVPSGSDMESLIGLGG